MFMVLLLWDSFDIIYYLYFLFFKIYFKDDFFWILFEPILLLILLLLFILIIVNSNTILFVFLAQITGVVQSSHSPLYHISMPFVLLICHNMHLSSLFHAPTTSYIYALTSSWRLTNVLAKQTLQDLKSYFYASNINSIQLCL